MRPFFKLVQTLSPVWPYNPKASYVNTHDARLATPRTVMNAKKILVASVAWSTILGFSWSPLGFWACARPGGCTRASPLLAAERVLRRRRQNDWIHRLRAVPDKRLLKPQGPCLMLRLLLLLLLLLLNEHRRIGYLLSRGEMW